MIERNLCLLVLVDILRRGLRPPALLRFLLVGGFGAVGRWGLGGWVGGCLARVLCCGRVFWGALFSVRFLFWVVSLFGWGRRVVRWLCFRGGGLTDALVWLSWCRSRRGGLCLRGAAVLAGRSGVEFVVKCEIRVLRFFKSLFCAMRF